MIVVVLLLLLHVALPVHALADQCREDIYLQILGAGGPELDDGRTSSGYQLWLNGQAKLLLDTGSGTSISFGDSGADFATVDAVLFSHLHTDHSADLPAFVKGAYFTGRNRDLYVIGPDGNHLMPATREFVQRLFGKNGAFSYLSDYLYKGRERFQLHAVDATEPGENAVFVKDFSWGQVAAITVHHGPVPALAWRVDVGHCRLVYSGDMSDKTQKLAGFATGADLLMLHMAIPDNAHPVAQNLHMSPTQIAQIAKRVQPKKLLLSHFMKRSERHFNESLRLIRQQFHGEVIIAERLLTIPLSHSDGAE